MTNWAGIIDIHDATWEAVFASRAEIMGQVRSWSIDPPRDGLSVIGWSSDVDRVELRHGDRWIRVALDRPGTGRGGVSWSMTEESSKVAGVARTPEIPSDLVAPFILALVDAFRVAVSLRNAVNAALRAVEPEEDVPCAG